MSHRPAGAPRKVVTAVDLQETSNAAAQWAIQHFAPDADHELVHVLEVPESARLLSLVAAFGQQGTSARGVAITRLEDLRESTGRSDTGIHVLMGKPAPQIVQFARESGADLIIVGEQGPRRGVGALLGSTAERVLFTSPVPVLVARKTGESPPRRLFIAVDDSEESGPVLEWSSELVHRFGARATVLTVVDRVLLIGDAVGLPSAELLRELENRAAEEMAAWLEPTVKEAGLSGDNVETVVAVGDPSYEIIARAAQQEADLILIGSGRGSVAPTPLIGRTVNKVVRSASCSVMVVNGSA